MPDPQPRTVGDELVRAADRDLDQLRYIEQLYQRLNQLIERVGELERELVDERTARSRLELRLYAHELRDADLPLLSAAGAELNRDGSWSPAPTNVLPLIRLYAPDHEPIPTTDNPTCGLELDDEQSDDDA